MSTNEIMDAAIAKGKEVAKAFLEERGHNPDEWQMRVAVRQDADGTWLADVDLRKGYERLPMDPSERLTCPSTTHGNARVYLEEDPEDDSIVYCPDCDYVFRNVLKYPVMEVTNAKGETYLKDMLTGEIVGAGESGAQ